MAPTYHVDLSGQWNLATKIDGELLSVNSFVFPSGFENHVKLMADPNAEARSERSPFVNLYAKITRSADVLNLLMVNDVLRNYFVKPIVRLYLPYLPYGRQDRVTTPNEPFSLRVFAHLLNSQGFDEVCCFDSHSDVTAALVDNIRVVKSRSLVAQAIQELRHSDEFYVVSPDAGAYKRNVSVVPKELHAKFATASKVRDLSNGNILSMTLDIENFAGADCFIVDDICSKGGTFKTLAGPLKQRNAGRVHLVVSHYEGSASLDELQSAGIDSVFTTDSIIGASSASSYLRIVDVLNFLL